MAKFRATYEEDEDYWNKLKNESIEPNRFRNIGDALLGIYPTANVGNVESAIEQKLAEHLPFFAEKCGYKVIPQFELGGFRYDFAIKNKDGKVVSLIECDGRAFHRTKEQRERDAKKNNLARERGCLMLRYGGKEICDDARRCAEDAIFRTFPR